MRYAILSDVHANLQAWKAVLLDIRGSGIDRIVCLGDIVGYGPAPAEVLKSLYVNVDDLVLGNHDAVIAGKLDESLFNPCARDTIRWTRRQLNHHAIRFLGGLPLSLDGGLFRCTHGDFSEPGAYHYVVAPEDAAPSWQAVDAPLLFVGHTHRSAIFLLGESGAPHMVEPQDFVLEPDKRFLVNVGSVGLPRDGETRACYCVFDTVERSVLWRRVPFDLDEYRDALAKAGLPSEPSYFLRHDPRKGKPPLRALLNFSPARTRAEGVKDAVAVREIKALRRRVAKWKAMAGAALGLAVLGAAAGAWASWRIQNRAAIVGPESLDRIQAVAFAADRSLLPLPAHDVAPPAPIPRWRIRLGDRRQQSVAYKAASGQFTLLSTAPEDEMRLESPPVAVAPNMKMRFTAQFRREQGFRGTAALVVSLTRKIGGRTEVVDQFFVKEPNQDKGDGWFLAEKTLDLPAGAEALTLSIRVRSTGTLRVRDLTLCRRRTEPEPASGRYSHPTLDGAERSRPPKSRIPAS
jgi:predicted phosphodiesterase